ncbi:MAG TPA: hypothetical protein VGG78_02385 [Gemmatimonadaceae bacterium]
MERNANDNFGSQNSGESSSGSGLGASSGSQAGSQGSSTSGYGAGSSTSSAGVGSSDASFSRGGTSEQGGIADRAKNIAGTAGERLSDVGSQVRDKAGNLKNSLANALESGAEKLRAQGAGGGQIAGAAATGGTSGMIADDNRIASATNQLAGGLQASADWLRDADLDGVKSGIERQVKEHPGRTLAVAVGVGYLLGKAFRK